MGTSQCFVCLYCITASSLLVNVEAVVQKTSGGARVAQEGALSHLRAILSPLLTFGLNDEIDLICKNFLLIAAPSVLSGVSLSVL